MKSNKLETALVEIKEILDKYDIAGIIIIHEPNDSKWMLKVNPSYSACVFENDELIIKAQQSIKVARDTSNMLHLLGECCFNVMRNISIVSKKFDDKTGAIHFYLNKN